MITNIISRLTRVGLSILLMAPFGSLIETPARAEEVWMTSQEAQEGHKVIVQKRVRGHDRTAGVFLGSRTYLGIEMVGLTPELREHFGAPSDAGVLISRVQSQSPAHAAGVLVGDIVTAIDTNPVASPSEVASQIGHRAEGETVSLEIWRDARLESVQATLEERDRTMIDIRRVHAEHLEDMDVRVMKLEVTDDLLDAEVLEQTIELDAELLEEALERLNETLSDPGWHQRVQQLNEHESGLQDRIEVLEEKLEGLEQEIESLPDDRSSSGFAHLRRSDRRSRAAATSPPINIDIAVR